MSQLEFVELGLSEPGPEVPLTPCPEVGGDGRKPLECVTYGFSRQVRSPAL